MTNHQDMVRSKQDKRNLKDLQVVLWILLSIWCGQTLYGQSSESGGLSPAVTVFDPSDGFATTRIPALVMANDGTLLAFCEGRLNGSGDWANIDILLRRSKDGGKTWEPLRVLVKHNEEMRTTGNAVPIVDRNGTIHFIYHRNYARAYYIRSSDHGKSWSEPADITPAFDTFRPEYNWKVIASGPGHGIQLRNGRLLVPVWLCEPDPSRKGGDHRPSVIATIYSDDFGKSWKRGEIVARNDDVSEGTTIVNPSESVAVELADGRVMLNMRSESKPHRRLISYSANGATGWSKPVFEGNLFDPVCMASLIRISGRNPRSGKGGALLFVNPDSERLSKERMNEVNFRVRKNLTAKLSYDEGKTWPVSRSLFPAEAGYSDLATDKKGGIYCLYETRNDDEGEKWKYRIVIQRFNAEWVSQSPDSPKK